MVCVLAGRQYSDYITVSGESAQQGGARRLKPPPAATANVVYEPKEVWAAVADGDHGPQGRLVAEAGRMQTQGHAS